MASAKHKYISLVGRTRVGSEIVHLLRHEYIKYRTFEPRPFKHITKCGVCIPSGRYAIVYDNIPYGYRLCKNCERMKD